MSDSDIYVPGYHCQCDDNYTGSNCEGEAVFLLRSIKFYADFAVIMPLNGDIDIDVNAPLVFILSRSRPV